MWASSPTINRLYFCYCVCIFSKTTPQSPSVTGLACRLGRGFCFTKVSPGHPHPLTRWAFPDHIIDYIIMLIWSVLFNPPVTISSWQPPLSKRGLSQPFYLFKSPVGSVGAFDFVKGVHRTPAPPDKVSLAKECCLLKITVGSVGVKYYSVGDDAYIVPLVYVFVGFSSFESENITESLHLIREVARRNAVTEGENGITTNLQFK